MHNYVTKDHISIKHLIFGMGKLSILWTVLGLVDRCNKVPIMCRGLDDLPFSFRLIIMQVTSLISNQESLLGL